jgi:hypothetical protein
MMRSYQFSLARSASNEQVPGGPCWTPAVADGRVVSRTQREERKRKRRGIPLVGTFPGLLRQDYVLSRAFGPFIFGARIVLGRACLG